MKISNAQLFWDDQDPRNAGWCWRYRDERGVEHSRDIEAKNGEDASLHYLAERIEAELGYSSLLHATGTIRVYRGSMQNGVIVLEDGEVVSWRHANR